MSFLEANGISFNADGLASAMIESVSNSSYESLLDWLMKKVGD